MLNPDKRTIVIRLQEGFLNRYGGGEAYGYYGFDNINGENRSFRVYAGYNLDGIEYLDNGLQGGSFILGGSAFYSNSTLDFGSPADYYDVEAGLSTGFRILPDLSIKASLGSRYSEIKYRTDTNASSGNTYRTDLTANSAVEYSIKAFPDPFEIDMNFREVFSFITPLYGTGNSGSFLTFLSVSSAKFSMGETGLFFQASAGWSGENLLLIDKFNLNDTPDLSVRGGWKYSDLVTDRFFMLNTEFRFPLMKFFLPPFFNTGINGFLYADEGWTGFDTSGAGSTLCDGYGLGLRLLFESPMFTYFSFSYGISRGGGTKFIFTATAGF